MNDWLIAGQKACWFCAQCHEKEYEMATGTVKWYNSTKGFGFIAPDAGGDDVFVHVTAVQAAGLTGLNDGDKVEYEIIVDKRRGKSSAGELKKL